VSVELPLASLMDEVARLQALAGSTLGREPVLDLALMRLEQSLEELHVASEELSVKHEELLLALAELDGERRRYRDLFDLAADGYLVTDGDDVVVEANRAAGELAGRPAESLVGVRLADLLDAASRREVARHTRLARAGQAGEVILTMASAVADDRLAQVRYRPREESRTGERRTHWTLVDLDRPILESEAGTEVTGTLAKRWLGVYGELIGVTESMLDGARDRVAGLTPLARQHVMETQIRPLEARLARLRRRRDVWADCHTRLVGLDVSQEAGQVRYRDRVVHVTRRERQLLRFLVERPDTFFPARVLLARAWQASYLSEEQVRTYIGRLRRKLEYLGLPCELVTRRPHGYALIFP
jgi:DNA-binding response OmpR family regulator